MRIVVTGATGLLGNNIVRAACRQGHEVIALARNATGSPSLQDLAITAVDADIADADSLKNAIGGPIDGVIHTAAQTHLGWKNLESSERINVLGTRNVLSVALQRAVRCVYVSTVNVLPVGDHQRIIDEESSGNPQIPCTYVVTKKRGEAEAISAIERGQDAVIVYPGYMLGPWDWTPSSGRMILELSRGVPPLAPSGGCSVCDARDVADAILRALVGAPRGERYILAGENWTYLRLWSEIATRLDRRKPWFAMRPPGRWVIGTVGDCLGAFSKQEPVFNSAALRMGSQFHWYSSDRARKTLGYESRPATESLEDAIAWLRQQGKLSNR
jgi:dihydroflavonol-4-reductase